MNMFSGRKPRARVVDIVVIHTLSNILKYGVVTVRLVASSSQQDYSQPGRKPRARVFDIVVIHTLRAEMRTKDTM